VEPPSGGIFFNMNLSDIFCQDKAVNTLTRAFAEGKIPHAYIFEGIEGVGKYTTAAAWAKLLLCKSPVKNDSCGKCPSCAAFEAGTHPDFHHVYKELIRFTRDSENRKKQPFELPIDVIREFLIEKVQIKPSFSESKVFVISEAEKLNIESQNAMLKVLEEPPNKSFIILLCTKLDNLLPTTKSRCQIVHFGALSEETIIEKLSARKVDKIEAKFWARLFGGSIGQAEFFSKPEPSFYKIKKEILNRFCKFQLAEAVDFAQWINSTASEFAAAWLKLKPEANKPELGRQAKKIFVSIIISAFTDAMKISFGGAEKMINFDQAEQIKLLAQRFGPQDCAVQIDKCYETIRFIDAAVNEKLVFEHLLLNCVVSDIMRVS
jgi:DNA polymerase III subunit delta'